MDAQLDSIRGIPLPRGAEIRRRAGTVAEYAMYEILYVFENFYRRLERYGSKDDLESWHEITTQISRDAFDLEVARQLIKEGDPDRAVAFLQLVLDDLGVPPDYFANDRELREQRSSAPDRTLAAWRAINEPR